MNTIELTYADFKTDIIAKGFPINYKKTYSDPLDTTKYSYEVFALDRTLVWNAIVSEAADITDFETNYKDTANKNSTYDTDGMSISAQKYSEFALMTDVSIRDTNVVNSTPSECKGYKVKTLIINNGLNQAVTLQAQASRDNVNYFNVGNPWEVAATTLTFATCEYYFPYLRLAVQCSVAPSSGTVSAWCEKMGA